MATFLDLKITFFSELTTDNKILILLAMEIKHLAIV